jgi:hypothetical protein
MLLRTHSFLGTWVPSARSAGQKSVRTLQKDGTASREGLVPCGAGSHCCPLQRLAEPVPGPLKPVPPACPRSLCRSCAAAGGTALAGRSLLAETSTEIRKRDTKARCETERRH